MLTTDFEIMDGRDLFQQMSSIPTKPGVYAWYHRLTIDETSAKLFRDTLCAQLNGPRPVPNFAGDLGPYTAELHPRESKFTVSKAETTKAVARSKNYRPRFAYSVLVTSVFQPPLYVGKADGRTGLRRRIKEHRDGRTGFGDEMLQKNLMPNELVVAYIVLESLPEKAAELLEYLLTVVSTPPYVKRRG